MKYRRVLIPGATYFFTLTLANRKSSLLVEHIDKLRLSFKKIKERHPFKIDGIVVLPDHLHAIMTFPSGDANYSQRWNLIKGLFSKEINCLEALTSNCKFKERKGVWQKRFWEHIIRDERDYEGHMDYIHYNPVKHNHVKKPSDWPISSIHHYITKGILNSDWGSKVEFSEGKFGE